MRAASKYRTRSGTCDRVFVRYARWDLCQVHLLDEHSGQIRARLYPQDKQRNASGIRRPLEPLATRGAAPSAAAVTPATGIAPLLEKLMAQQARHRACRRRTCPKMNHPTTKEKACEQETALAVWTEVESRSLRMCRSRRCT